MYIEDRLFSESTEEILYSVTMDEFEYDLYSEFQERIFGKYNQVGAMASDAFKGIGGQMKKGNKKFNKILKKKTRPEYEITLPPNDSSDFINDAYREAYRKSKDPRKIDIANLTRRHSTHPSTNRDDLTRFRDEGNTAYNKRMLRIKYDRY